MKEIKLSITHYKVLHTVDYLNKMKLYPNQEGVYKLLHGDIDEESESFRDMPTFGTLISYPSKKVCRYILTLVRYDYLTHIFDRETKELYLILTDKGKAEIARFLDKHTKPYPKKQKMVKKTIVKIGE